jgi:hypothetical protein
VKKDIPKDFIRRMKSFKTAQAVNLAIWAGLNILLGGIFIFQAQTHHFYFFTMNISWNVVNLCVAVFLYTHHNNVFNRPISIINQMDFQRHIEKAISFNLGLDMTFMATGFAMYFYGKTPQVDHPNLWLGFGISVILQGSFLLIQDIVFYRLHNKNREIIYPNWQVILIKL